MVLMKTCELTTGCLLNIVEIIIEYYQQSALLFTVSHSEMMATTLPLTQVQTTTINYYTIDKHFSRNCNQHRTLDQRFCIQVGSDS